MKARSFSYGVLVVAVMFSTFCQKADLPEPSPGRVILPMTTRAGIEIKAPVEKVFSYVADFNTITDYYPGAKSVTVQGQGLGMIAKWTLEAEGKYIEGESVIVDYVPNQLISGTSPGGETWNEIFLPAPDGGTKLILVVQYFPEIQTDSEEAREKMEKESYDHIMLMLKNLKEVMEK